MTIADLIVRRLAEAGVRYLFGMPGGGSNLDLIEAASRHDLPFVLTHTETAGAVMAIAQAELTGCPGACLATIGPGAASAVDGVACALLERAPLILLTDMLPARSSAFSHQRIDHQSLLRPVTKWTAAVDERTVAATLNCAVSVALNPPPGPVHLDLAPDVSAASVPSATQPVTQLGAEFVAPDRTDARRLMSSSRRPLLIVGLGARNEADVKAVRALCDRGVPALVTYKGKGIVPDDHAAFAGVFTNGAIERSIVDQADVIVGAGLDPVELLPRPWTIAAPIVYCGRSRVSSAHVPFAGQLIDELETLDGLLPRTTDWDLERVKRSVADQRSRIRHTSTIGALSPSEVVDAVCSVAGADARVTVDAGAHMFPVTMLWPVPRPGDFLISNGLSTMGFALPAAIGAALLERDRRVIAFTGDAGLLMCVAELRTAARERLNVVTVVFDDERLSLIDVKQRQKGYRQAGVAMGQVDWEAIGRGFGVPAFVADSVRGMNEACAEALKIDGPSLIAARVDPSTYEAILTAVRG